MDAVDSKELTPLKTDALSIGLVKNTERQSQKG